MAQNFLFAWPNRAEGATLTGGAWSATLPLANLKTRFSFEPARTTNALPASTQCDVALDAPRDIKCLALLRHNLSVGARYRLRLSATAGDYSTHLWDSGTRSVWASIFPFGTKSWGDDGWWGGMPAAEDIAGYPSLLLCVLPTVVRARYLRLELFDEGHPAGYIEAARLWVSGQWQPTYNVAYGMQLGWEDPSRTEEALDGTEYHDERPKTRVIFASLDVMSPDDAHAIYLEMQRQLGTTRELLVVPDYGDTTHLIRRSFVGRLRKLSALEAWAYQLYKGALEIKETV